MGAAMYKYLIFDLDDTLLDFKAGEKLGLDMVLTGHGISDLASALERYQVINHDLWRQVEQGADRTKLLDGRFAKLFAEFGQAVDGHTLEMEYRHYLDTNYAKVPEADTTLRALVDQNYTILAGTNGVKATQEARLSHSGLGIYFDAVYTSEEIGHSKPAAEFFQHIFDHERGMQSSKTVMIGDGLTADIQGAQNFGLDRIWVNLRNEANQTEFIPTHEVHQLRDLQAILA